MIFSQLLYEAAEGSQKSLGLGAGSRLCPTEVYFRPSLKRTLFPSESPCLFQLIYSCTLYLTQPTFYLMSIL